MLDAFEAFMNDRTARYKNFDQFFKDSKKIFEEYAKNDQSNERLDNLFSLYICPGGRDGGQNKKVVDVFYGNRPFESVTELNDNLTTTTKLETAHGAILAYYRTDNGHVVCNLYPAKSENQRPSEEIILLDFVSDPSRLKEKSKRHWKMFVSYMESTCLDGEPNFWHRVSTFYLRNFKQYVVQSVIQQRKVIALAGEIAKFALTVGLSGFIILLFTWAKEDSDNNTAAIRHQEIKQQIENIETNSKAILESVNSININLLTYYQKNGEKIDTIGTSLKESNQYLEKAFDKIEEIKQLHVNKPSETAVKK